MYDLISIGLLSYLYHNWEAEKTQRKRNIPLPCMHVFILSCLLHNYSSKVISLVHQTEFSAAFLQLLGRQRYSVVHETSYLLPLFLYLTPFPPSLLLPLFSPLILFLLPSLPSPSEVPPLHQEAALTNTPWPWTKPPSPSPPSLLT